MVEEFKIKTSIELDDKDAREKIEKLKNSGQDKPIKLNLKIGELDKLSQQAEQLKGIFNKAFKIDNTALSNLKQIESTMKEINKLSRRSQESLLGGGSGNTGNINNEQQDLIRQYKEISNVVSRLQNQMRTGLGDSSIERTTEQIERLKRQLDSVYAQMNSSSQARMDMFDASRATRDLADMNRNLSRIEDMATQASARLNGLGDNIDTDKVNRLRNELQELKQTASRNIDLNLDVGNIVNRIQEINQEVRNLERVDSLRSNFSRIEDSIRQAFGNERVEAFRRSLEQLQGSAGNLNGDFNNIFDRLTREMRDARQEAERLNNTVSRGGGFFNDFYSSVASYSIGDMLGDALTDGIRSMKDVILELDSSMTDLKKVAEPTDIDSTSELDRIREKAIQTAKDVGMSASQVQESIASSLQAGIGGMQESIAAARQSMILANVGDMDVEGASSAVNTIINGFRIEPLKEMQVQVGNTTKKTTELTAAMDMLNCLAC